MLAFIILCIVFLTYIAVDSNKIHNAGTISLAVDGKKVTLNGVEIMLEIINRDSEVERVIKSEIVKGKFIFIDVSDCGVRLKFSIPMEVYGGEADIEVWAEYFIAYYIENKYYTNDFNIDISINTTDGIVTAGGFVKTKGDPQKYIFHQGEQNISEDIFIYLGVTGGSAFIPTE